MRLTGPRITVRRTTTVAAGIVALAVTVAACAPDDMSAGADDTATAEPGGDALVVGLDPHYPPDEYIDENGDHVGWEVDLVKAIGEKLDREITFQDSAFDSLIPGIEAGRYDIVIGNLGVTPERLEVVDIVSLSQPDLAFLAKADSGIAIETLDDLCGVSLAVSRGSTQDLMAIDQNDKCVAEGKEPIDRQVYQGGDQNILAVQSGRAETYWTSHSRAVHYENQPDSELVIAGWTERGTELTGLALGKDSELSPQVLDAVNAMIEDGTYLSILEEWDLERAAVEESRLNPADG
jgi:polar amino acid transport system substrate-binding protein